MNTQFANALRVSVVVPTRHRDEMLAETLTRLAPGAQTGVPDEWYEVIVTDNGQTSTAESMIVERFPWVRWVKGPGGGPADNRNNGIQFARAAWVAFTDDDCTPDTGWLKGYIQAIEAACGSGEKLPVAFEGAIDALGAFPVDLAECPANLNGGCFWTANVMVRREVFAQVGGFDTSFPNNTGGEDHELYLRLRKLGPVPFVPRARVSHPVRQLSVREAARNAPARAVAWSHCIMKHPAELMEKGEKSVAGRMIRAQVASVKTAILRRYWGEAVAMAISLPRVALAVNRHVKKVQQSA